MFTYSSAEWVVVRKNRHILEVSRALMVTMSVLNYFVGGGCALTAVYLVSRMPLFWV